MLPFMLYSWHFCNNRDNGVIFYIRTQYHFMWYYLWTRIHSGQIASEDWEEWRTFSWNLYSIHELVGLPIKNNVLKLSNFWRLFVFVFCLNKMCRDQPWERQLLFYFDTVFFSPLLSFLTKRKWAKLSGGGIGIGLPGSMWQKDLRFLDIKMYSALLEFCVSLGFSNAL